MPCVETRCSASMDPCRDILVIVSVVVKVCYGTDLLQSLRVAVGEANSNRQQIANQTNRTMRIDSWERNNFLVLQCDSTADIISYWSDARINWMYRLIDFLCNCRIQFSLSFFFFDKSMLFFGMSTPMPPVIGFFICTFAYACSGAKQNHISEKSILIFWISNYTWIHYIKSNLNVQWIKKIIKEIW